MKIIISESTLKNIINELNSELKSEMEIIYKDKNLICLIPKTQRISKILGNKTNWCQTTILGFNSWSRNGLLFRFLFKNGRKIRMTYSFKSSSSPVDYHWANENGYHVLDGHGNPFEPKTKERIRSTEQDILDLISQIPQQCKNEVLKTIEKHNNNFEYCYDIVKQNTFRSEKYENIKNTLLQKYEKKMFKLLLNDENTYLRIKLNDDKLPIILYSPNYKTEDPQEIIFKSIPEGENKIKEILKKHNIK